MRLISTLAEIEKLVDSFASLDSFEVLIETIKVQIELVAESDTNGLYLYNEEENKLKLFYAKGFSKVEKENAELTAMERHPGYVFKTGEILWVNDQDAEHHPFSINSVKKSHTRSRLYVPVKSNNQIIGAFGLQSEKPNAFTDKHLAVLKVFASLAGDAYLAIKKNNLIKKQNEENKRLAYLATHTPNNVIYGDKEGKITWVNEYFENYTGYKLHEIIGKTPGSFLTGPETEPDKTSLLRKAIQTKTSVELTIANYKKNGELYYVAVQLNPVFDDKNELLYFISVQQDVTDLEIKNKKIAENQKQLEANLKSIAEAQKRYSNLLQTTHDLIVSLDSKGTILYVNNSWLVKMNYTLREVLGSNIFNYIHPDSQQHCMSFFGEVTSGQHNSLEVNYSLISKKGIKVDIEGNVICKYENNTLSEVNSFLKDVTEINRVKIEEQRKAFELKQSKDQLERVMSSLNETVWGVSLPEFKLNYVSESALALYEMPLENWYANANLWSDVIHPDDKERVLKESEALFTVGYTNLEYRIVTGSNKVKWIYSNTKVLKNEEGVPYLMTGIAGDITAKKLAEIELLNYKTAIDSSAIVSITDTKGFITYVNDKFCEISKYSQHELIGANHNIVNSNYHSKEFFKHLWQTISSGANWKGEIKNKAKDGSEYYVETTIVPFMENGKPIQYIAIRYESTELKLKEAAILKQKQFYENILNNTPVDIAVYDKKQKYIFVNKEAVKDDETRQWIIGKDDFEYAEYKNLPIEIAEKRKDNYNKINESNPLAIWLDEHTQNGENSYQERRLYYLKEKGITIGIGLDVTKLKRHELLLAESVYEKETLLGEVHHRVKNNLAVIDGMVELKKSKETDDHLKDVLTDIQSRIKTVALVHQKLYQSTLFSKVNLGDYIKELIDYHKKILNKTATEQFKSNLHIEHIYTDISKAVTFGLIFNELLSNSFKYGIINNFIEISMSMELKEDRVHFIYTDSGKGLYQTEDEIIKSKGFGLNLINTLCRQLKAQVNYPKAANFILELDFPIKNIQIQEPQ
jgi:PAS domain S-box-containing protein